MRIFTSSDPRRGAHGDRRRGQEPRAAQRTGGPSSSAGRGGYYSYLAAVHIGEPGVANETHGGRRERCADRGAGTYCDGRAVLGRVTRTINGDGPRGQSCGRSYSSRRRLQTANFAV